MTLNFGCQNAGRSANRPGSFGSKTNQPLTMFVVALAALLSGVGASVQAQTAAFSGSTSAFDTTHFTNPQGIATDAAGDVFIGNNASTRTVLEFTRTAPGTYSAPVTLPAPGTPYGLIRGIVVDPSGNLWVADNGNGSSGGNVYELVNTAGTLGTPTPVGSGWAAPWGIAADASGNVFVADNAANSIVKISAGTPTTLNTGGIAAPRGVAIDSSGNIFGMNGNNSNVIELTAASSYVTSTTVGTTSFSSAGDIAIDANGNIWVADYGNNLVREMTFASSYQTVMNWGTGLNGPVATWLDADGAWLVSNFGDNSIRQIATGAVGMGTVAVNSTSATQTLSFTFTGATSTTVQAPVVVTKGATGQDFADAGGGTCTTTNGNGNPYAPGTTCSVNVSLTPKYAGARNGAVKLLDTSGNLLASALIYGVGTGPEVVFPGNTTITTLGSGFSQPLGLTRDSAGNVFVADTANNAVKEILAAGGYTTVTTLGSGFSTPKGIALDGAGNVFVADTGNNAVKEILAAGGYSTVTTLASGFSFSSPIGVAVDGGGNVYVADNGDSSVYEMSSGCASAGCVTTLGSAGGFGSATGVAVDASGNVYVAGSGSVKEITQGCIGGGCGTPLGGGFNTPIGVAVDASGNVYVADYGTNQVNEIPAGCVTSSCVTTLGSGFSSPAGVALDGAGNVYIADTGNSLVKVLNLTSPPSLVFGITSNGTQSSDSPKTVTLANIGNTPLIFPVPESGENPNVPANFTLDGSTTCPEVLSSGSAGTLAAGASCALAVDFIPQTNVDTGSLVLTDNNQNASPSTTQSISLSGNGATVIIPYIQVNGGGWKQEASVTVNAGDTVDLGPQGLVGDTFSWTGPGGFSSTSRTVSGVTLNSASNVFTFTYTNTSGIVSTQTFTVNVASTSLTPYIQVNGGAWQQLSTLTVNAGDTVNLGPQGLVGGTYSWSGPGFTSTSRVASAVPLNSASNAFTLTYTNSVGVNSTVTFTINVGATTLTPYIQVNGAAWQQLSTATVSPGDTVNLGPQGLIGGTYSWSGPGFTSTSRVASSVPLNSTSNAFTLTYTNSVGVNSTVTFTINVGATTLTPYIQVNGGAWQQLSTATVSPGDTVNLGPQALIGGTYSWSGPGFTSTSRVASAVPLNSTSNAFNLTYTNSVGVNSTATFTIHVGATTLTPYIQVNGGAWQQLSTLTVNAGDTVNLGPQALTGGTYSWSGPSFTSTSRVASAVPLNSTSNVFTLTYTNAVGVNSTATFTIHAGATTLTPYIQLNGGAWQQRSTLTVSPGDTVNLGPQGLVGGTYSWSGPGFTSTSRVASSVPLNSTSNVFTLTYTNTVGVNSTVTFTITVGATPLIPYIQVNGAGWQQTSTMTVTLASAVDLGPQGLSGGTFSWSGPGGYHATSRAVLGVPLTSGSNVFTLTYTNTVGAVSTQTFTVTAH